MVIHRLATIKRRWKEARVYKSRIPTSKSMADKQLVDSYCSAAPFEKRVACVNEYFLSAFQRHSNASHTRCYFKGAFSYQARDMDAIEGCTRLLPFLASMAVNAGDNVIDDNSAKVTAGQLLYEALTNGTNPALDCYWGEPVDYSQLICEAADVALALWIAREIISMKLSDLALQTILVWLKKAASCQIVDNNWHLFRFLTQLVIEHFDKDFTFDLSSYERIKTFYVGDGWFSDGEEQAFDYYNAWAFHYSLCWINQIKPSLDADFILSTNAEFCQGFKYFFSPKGIPFFGRSISYRLAAPCPLLASVLMGNSAVEPGLVRRAFDSTWKYFLQNGALKNGVPTQGYFEQDLRFQDEYSGPGSSLWSLRSLILLLQIPNSSAFYKSKELPLPIEQHNYTVFIESIKLELCGDSSSHNIVATWTERPENDDVHADNFSLMLKLKELVSQRPQRPKNTQIKNGLKKYSVLKPYNTR